MSRPSKPDEHETRRIPGADEAAGGASTTPAPDTRPRPAPARRRGPPPLPVAGPRTRKREAARQSQELEAARGVAQPGDVQKTTIGRVIDPGDLATTPGTVLPPEMRGGSGARGRAARVATKQPAKQPAPNPGGRDEPADQRRARGDQRTVLYENARSDELGGSLEERLARALTPGDEAPQAGQRGAAPGERDVTGAAATAQPPSLPDRAPDGAAHPTRPAAQAEAPPATAAADPAGDGPPEPLPGALLAAAQAPEGEEARTRYIGKTIDGRYKVKSLLGRGGMGSVFRVEQLLLKKQLAMKLLHEDLVGRKQQVSRFTREARAISRLSSPHTVRVYDFGRTGDVFFLVMELLDGEPLDVALDVVGGRLPVDRAVRIVEQMCDSLGEAHGIGIVHRDLKPENIMLIRDGAHPDFVKILDFGLAKVKDVDDPYTIHSRKDIFGTPAYMSPEQIRAGEIDPRADVYAVGVLFFRMLAGKVPFHSETSTFDILKAHLTTPPPRMSDIAPDAGIPEGLEEIVARLLAKKPDDRIQSMAELREALEACRKRGWASDGSGIAQRVHAPPELDAIDEALANVPVPDEAELDRIVRRGRTRRTAHMVGVTALVLAVLGGFWFVNGSARSGKEREPNNEPARANPMSEEGRASGVLGERRGPKLADRDCFRLPQVGRDQMLDVQVTGLPTMALAVEVFGDKAKPLHQQAHRLRGEGQLVRRLDGARGPRVLCVTEDTAEGQVAGEALSDTYHVRATTSPRPKNLRLEREPNDTADAPPLAPGLPVLGALDGARDVDHVGLKLDGPARLDVTLRGHDRQPLRGLVLSLLDADGRTLHTRSTGDETASLAMAFVASEGLTPVTLRVSPAENAAALWRAAKLQSADYVLDIHTEPASTATEREPNNKGAEGLVMTPGGWHAGDADAPDGEDWWRIAAPTGQPEALVLDARAAEGSAIEVALHRAGREGADPERRFVLGDGEAQTMTADEAGAWAVVIRPVAPRRGRKRLQRPARYRLRYRWR